MVRCVVGELAGGMAGEMDVLETILGARLGVAQCRAACGDNQFNGMEEFQACWDMCGLLGKYLGCCKKCFVVSLHSGFFGETLF